MQICAPDALNFVSCFVYHYGLPQTTQGHYDIIGMNNLITAD